MIISILIPEPISVITGSPDLYAKAGGNVTLICRLRNFTVPPPYVFWYHDDQMINYDLNRQVSIIYRDLFS